jgi:hypothetical protein
MSKFVDCDFFQNRNKLIFTPPPQMAEQPIVGQDPLIIEDSL